MLIDSFGCDESIASTVRLSDTILDYMTDFAPGFEHKYNKYYIGLAQNGRAQNFVTFKPQRKAIRIDVGMLIPPELKAKLEEADAYSGASRPAFRFDRGQRSGMIAATLPG